MTTTIISNLDLIRHAFTNLKQLLPSRAEQLLSQGIDNDIEIAVGRALDMPVEVRGGRYTEGSVIINGKPQGLVNTLAKRKSVGLSDNLNLQWPKQSSILEYLHILNGLTADELEKEALSKNWRWMGSAIKHELWVEGEINHAFADVLDRAGYTVSYQPSKRLLIISIAAGSITWTV